MPLTKDQILSYRPTMTEFDVPSLGGSVLLKPLTVSQFDRFLAETRKESKPGSIMALLVAFSACDEDGKRLFSDINLKEVESLGIQEINAIGNEVLRVSKLTNDDQDQPENPR